MDINMDDNIPSSVTGNPVINDYWSVHCCKEKAKGEIELFIISGHIIQTSALSL